MREHGGRRQEAREERALRVVQHTGVPRLDARHATLADVPEPDRRCTPAVAADGIARVHLDVDLRARLERRLAQQRYRARPRALGEWTWVARAAHDHGGPALDV